MTIGIPGFKDKVSWVLTAISAIVRAFLNLLKTLAVKTGFAGSAICVGFTLLIHPRPVRSLFDPVPANCEHTIIAALIRLVRIAVIALFSSFEKTISALRRKALTINAGFSLGTICVCFALFINSCSVRVL